jgi:DNA-binding NarL/FixJ family response regulator
MKHGSDNDAGKRSILIVDDHFFLRRVLTELLSQQPDLCVRAAVDGAEQALEVIEREPIDLAIFDISLGHADGITLTDRLKRKCPELIVLILSMHDERFYGQRALRAGASGYVAKQQACDTILEAIHTVLGGQTYFHSAS